MFSKIICLLLCSGFIFQSLAQQYLADSIHKELLIENKPLNRMDLHLGLVRAYAFTEDEGAQAKYIDSCFYFAEKHKFKKAEIYARIFQANLDFNKGGTPDSYYVVLEEALRDAREISARNEEVFVLYHLSDYYGGNLNKLSQSRRILEDILNTPSPKFSRKNKAYVSKHLGYTLFSEGNDSLAIAYLEKAISLFDSIETHPEIDPLLGRTPAMEWDQGLMGKGMALIYLGRVYTKLGQFDKALQFVNAASKIYEQTASLSFYAWTRADAARIYEYKGLLSEANENFQIAVKGYEKIGAIQDLKFAYRDLGNLFYKMSSTASAKKNFRKAYEISKRTKDTISIIENLGWLGMVASAEGKQEDALNYRQEAYELNTIFKDSTQLASVLSGLVGVYIESGRIEEAIAFQKRSKELNEHYGNHLHVQHDLNSLCSLYMQVGLLDSARFYAELASQHAESYANLDQKKYLALILSSLEERSGNYQEALQHHKTYASLFLSAYTEKAQALQKNEEVRQNVAEVKAEKDEVEREKELLSDLNQLYIALAFALGIILLLVIFVLYKLRQNKQILERKNAELRKLNSTKDKFFGIIAHDLRNPLIALDWVSEQMNIYLKRKNIDRLYRLAEHTETTAKRLSALLDNLLNWSLVQTGSIPYDPAHVDLSQITEEILELYRPLAQAKGIELNNDIRDSAEVFADERAVHMIIRNLIGNALKFTHNEGKVIISNERENGHQQIIITDSGRGISPDLLPNLFKLDKKLSMGKAQEKGSGLGLMLCKELVELNKGEIRASSELGKGSRFVISLPAV